MATDLNPLTPATLLARRWGDPWLLGADDQRFWSTLDQYRHTLDTLPPGPTVLVTSTDPWAMLAVVLAASERPSRVLLANPGWQRQQWQQIAAMVQPDWVCGPVPAAFSPNCPCPHPLNPLATLAPTEALVGVATGGTSGQLRFVMHRWTGLLTAVQGFQQHFQCPSLHAYCVLPVFHVSGLMQALRVLAGEGQLALQPYAHLKTGQRWTLPQGDRFLSLVPTQLSQVMTQGEPAYRWLRTFTAVLLGGAPAWPALLHQARCHRLPLAPTYGMTETAAQVATLHPTDFLQGCHSSGPPLPHVQLHLDHAASTGPSRSVLAPPSATDAQPIRLRTAALGLGYLSTTGWHPLTQPWSTDDLGYLDQQGHLQVVGRSSGKIITGGENVFPAAVEAVLWATGQVQDVAVVGLPDAHWGECVTAMVVLAPGTTLAALQTAATPDLLPHQRPKHWLAVAALPRTGQHKLNRPAICQLAQDRLSGTANPD